jgi:hypothetical protein
MKKIILFCFSLFTISSSLIAQNWLWGNEASVSVNGVGDVLNANHPVSADAAGNAYITGWFENGVTFGSHTLNTNSIGAYFVKYSSAGNVLWAQQSITASTACMAQGISTASDAAGNSFFAGIFQDTVSFGAFTLREYSPSYYYMLGYGDAFLVKYGPAGNVIWAKQANLLNINSIIIMGSTATDAKGNLYEAGEFYDTVSFGTFTLTGNSGNAYLTKYSPNGNVIWARQTISASAASGASGTLTTDAAGNSYETGVFGDTVSFGAFTLINPTALSDVFIAKYDSGGNVLWAKQGLLASSASMAQGISVAVDGQGNSYIGGIFQDTLYLGAFTLISNTPASNFIAKYDHNGNVIWAKQIKILDNNGWTISSLAADTLKRGGCYFMLNTPNPGTSPYKLQIDSTLFSLSSAYTSATAFIQVDSGGNVVCGNMFTEGDEDDGDGVGCSKSGAYVYITGDLTAQTIFGNDTLPTGNDVPFIARWNPCGSFNNEGINEASPSTNSVSLFPNPNNGLFTIQVKSEELITKSIVEVYNMLGEKVYSETLNIKHLTLSIDLGTKSAGVYLYRVLNETGSLLGEGKFIIQK